MRQLAETIGDAPHLVFILIDGLGMNLLARLGPDSFLRRHHVQQIHAAFPSTTACALSSLATAEYANRHGAAGWFTHVPELQRTIATLPFTDRVTTEPLGRAGLSVDQLILAPPILPRLDRSVLTIVPALLAETAYNLFMRGGTTGAGYASIAGAIDRIVLHVTESRRPTYSHLYLPEIDALCHRHGVGSDEVLAMLLKIDEQLGHLRAAIGSRARIVATADHGLIDVPVADQTLLTESDPLMPLLHVAPSGDARMPIFHVRQERRRDFVGMFVERFTHRFLLLTIDQLEAMQLCGPGPFAPQVRPRFGDFVAIPIGRSALAFHPSTKPLGRLYIALHAGLSADEMQVPLIVG